MAKKKLNIKVDTINGLNKRYVEIHGYSRIQNANNPSDVQNMPNGVNAMLTVNA